MVAIAAPSSSSTSTTTSKTSTPTPSTTPVAVAPTPNPAPTPDSTPTPATTPQSPDSTQVPAPVAAQAQAGNRGESPNTSAPSSTSSSPTTVPSPLPSNAFQFSQPNNLTTCTSADFVWSFEDQAIIPLTIMVTNERGARPAGQTANTTLISRVLTTTASATACSIIWPTVNVPPGMYSLVGFNTSSDDPSLFSTTTFWVNAGKDTSCVTTDNSATPTDTSNDGSATDPSESTPSSPRSLSTGAMVGTIAGVIVGVCGIVAALVIPRYRKRKPPPNSSPRPGGPYILF
ncbi:hypothetical protein BD410DRAFT_429914 [Rickenella mellea]|uniref:Mid2 domain-containing protein n=1 Tax=Rickenella mellea TaxID=50990 RepID=A0A4Y7QIY6_9AGAM|nr:hypothetical protein BD410DRAFT_429914 [Rickenella mellea]